MQLRSETTLSQECEINADMNEIQEQRHLVSTCFVRKDHQTLNHSFAFTDIFRRYIQFKLKCPDEDEKQSLHPRGKRNQPKNQPRCHTIRIPERKARILDNSETITNLNASMGPKMECQQIR